MKLKSGESLEVADPRATRAMVALMDMNAVLGGAACHWGGPSAFAELMSAAHGLMFAEARRLNSPWHERFSFVNDGGHCENGLYALKANYGFAQLNTNDLKKFRSIDSPLSGHGESHLFPQGVLLSNGPLGSALPQAQGLAWADAWSGKMERVTLTAITDGGCMEGEAREALAAIPGLALNGKLAPFILVISDNNTKLTGRIDVDSYSMAPTFQSLQALGWEVIHLEDGHDLQKCVATLESAIDRVRANPKKPIAIHARTIKGYGVKRTMDASSGGHGFPLKAPSELKAFLSEIYADAPVPNVFLQWTEELEAQVAAKKPTTQPSLAQGKAEPVAAAKKADEKVQVGVSKALINRRKAGLPIVSISADLPGSTGLAEFQKAFPDCTQDVGVAESNMMSVAAGAAKLGCIPVVDTFAQFGVTKGALPLTMASLSQAPMLCVFSHVGFQDAADGASHQALSYYSMVSSIPHVRVYSLTCSEEAEALVGQAIDEYAALTRAGQTPESSVFFLGRENFPSSYGVTQYRLGRAQVVRDSAQPALVIAAAGAMIGQALLAAEQLAAQGVEAVVINPSIINCPDVGVFQTYLERCGGRLVTVEDHQIIGGMGAILCHSLVQAGVDLRVRSLGVRGEFGRSAYNAIELYRQHGLDSDAITQAARSLL